MVVGGIVEGNMAPQAIGWLDKSLAQRQQELQQLIKEAPDYIKLVEAGSMGVVASLGEHFSYAIFGRDSIRVAKDLIETHEQLARTIILVLAQLQGTKYDNKSEEEPGKIHHEHRSLVFSGARIPPNSEAIMHRLQQKWGDEHADEMTYYGSYDATPLYVRLVHNYIQHYGDAILNETYQNKDGESKSIGDSLRAAIDWVVGKLEGSEWGLLEYKRVNPNGMSNQVWKDSETSYLHTDGTVASFEQGIAAIELQGYAYDTLLDACDLFEKDEMCKNWRALAQSIQQKTIDYFWMEDEQFFAQGLDRDETMGRRQIKTLTSNPGLLLRSGLLRDLEPSVRQKFANSLAVMLTSPEFISDGGIRCRSLRHKAYPGFPDYHGSFTTWPKETYEIAKGLHSHGFVEQAQELDDKVLQAVAESGDFYEFFYVNDDGSIWYNPSDGLDLLKEIFGENANMPVPERGQAWTISAVLAIINHRKHEN